MSIRKMERKARRERRQIQTLQREVYALIDRLEAPQVNEEIRRMLPSTIRARHMAVWLLAVLGLGAAYGFLWTVAYAFALAWN